MKDNNKLDEEEKQTLFFRYYERTEKLDLVKIEQYLVNKEGLEITDKFDNWFLEAYHKGKRMNVEFMSSGEVSFLKKISKQLSLEDLTTLHNKVLDINKEFNKSGLQIDYEQDRMYIFLSSDMPKLEVYKNSLEKFAKKLFPKYEIDYCYYDDHSYNMACITKK